MNGLNIRPSLVETVCVSLMSHKDNISSAEPAPLASHHRYCTTYLGGWMFPMLLPTNFVRLPPSGQETKRSTGLPRLQMPVKTPPRLVGVLWDSLSVGALFYINHHITPVSGCI